MKRIFTNFRWGLLLGLAVIVSCNKDKRPELFELNQFVDFDIPPGLNTFDTHFFVISPLASSFDEELEASGRNRIDVKTIESKDAFLTTAFKDVNLKYIRTVSVYIFDPFNPTDKIEFFYLDPVPYKNQTSIRLFPGIADISHWVDQEFFGIEIRLNFADVTPTFTQMRLEFDMRAVGE